MSIKAIKNEIAGRMDKTLRSYEEELHTIRAGRANPTLLDRITVEAYGQQTPLNQVAGVSAPEARLLTIQPWDAGLIPEIEKAILKSDLGLNPSNDGKLIRLTIPQLTEERRKDLIKLVGSYEENAKIALRNIRREYMDKVKQMEKDKEISEDEERVYEEEVQKVVKDYMKKIEDISAKKEAELMEI
ncbi:MAG: ribosome recycling factor [Tissierellia bacterium]|nr:ribosome recycling factor [Tissierellia bacterium]